MKDEKRRPKIALLTAHTLQDRKQSSWGGTVDYMTQALQKHCGDVYHIGPVHSRKKLIGKVIHKASRLLLKKNFAYNHSVPVAKEYSQIAAQRLAGKAFDVIVAPSCGTDIAFLETDIPIVLIEDATFALLHGYYPQYSNLLKRSVSETHLLEGLTIRKAKLLLYTSEWAARSALEVYHADKEKVYVLPFGANFASPPAKEVVQAKKKSDTCRLLFIGVDWQRKGGEIAFETLLKLEEMGIQAELVVLGCVPPKTFVHEHMKVIPFLNKKDERQRRELNRLFEISSFLLLPTRSDCAPMVLAEAGAFGLPAITTHTGGIPGIIREGENGFMLPLTSRGRDYAQVIAEVYRDDQRYAELILSSRAAFDKRLNWDAWGAAVTEIIQKMLDQGVASWIPGSHPSHVGGHRY
jgi:glycosyltransferase involved in cell wall biosynthesis